MASVPLWDRVGRWVNHWGRLLGGKPARAALDNSRGEALGHGEGHSATGRCTQNQDARTEDHQYEACPEHQALTSDYLARSWASEAPRGGAELSLSEVQDRPDVPSCPPMGAMSGDADRRGGMRLQLPWAASDYHNGLVHLNRLPIIQPEGTNHSPVGE